LRVGGGGGGVNGEGRKATIQEPNTESVVVPITASSTLSASSSLPPNILCLRIVRKNRIEYYITSSSQDFLAETRGRCCERRNLEECRGVFASYYHGMIYSIIFYLMLKSKRIYTLSQHIKRVIAFTRIRLSDLLSSGSHYCP